MKSSLPAKDCNHNSTLNFLMFAFLTALSTVHCTYITSSPSGIRLEIITMSTESSRMSSGPTIKLGNLELPVGTHIIQMTDSSALYHGTESCQAQDMASLHQRLEQHGYVFVRGVMDQTEVATALSAVTQLASNQPQFVVQPSSKSSSTAKSHKDGDVQLRGFCVDMRSAVMVEGPKLNSKEQAHWKKLVNSSELRKCGSSSKVISFLNKLFWHCRGISGRKQTLEERRIRNAEQLDLDRSKIPAASHAIRLKLNEESLTAARNKNFTLFTGPGTFFVRNKGHGESTQPHSDFGYLLSHTHTLKAFSEVRETPSSVHSDASCCAIGCKDAKSSAASVTCDICNKSTHLHCLNPPIQRLSELNQQQGDLLCINCANGNFHHYTIWTALTNTNVQTGRLCVLPRSHVEFQGYASSTLR